VGGSSILNEYQANSLLDVAQPTKFNDNRHRMSNSVGRDQKKILHHPIFVVLMPEDITQLVRIALKLAIVWLILGIGRSIGAFK
jgi:hypothetical protein